MSILSVKSLLLGKFSFGGGIFIWWTLLAHTDFSVSFVCGWILLRYSVYTGSGEEKFTGEFMNVNKCKFSQDTVIK